MTESFKEPSTPRRNPTNQNLEPGKTVSPAPSAPPTAQTGEPCKTGFYCYLGPTLPGLLRNGTIFRGSREDAIAAAASAIASFPLVKSLIISGDALPQARLELKKAGSALYAHYHKLIRKNEK